MNRLSSFLLWKVSGVVLASCLSLNLSGTLNSAEVFSPVFGFMKFDCPADSDTVVSAPFHPAPRWAGRAAGSPTDQGGGTARLSLKDSPAFAAGELTSTPHFLYCRDAAGVHRGRHFLVVAHGADTVDVAATLADLGSLTTDGLVSVIPAWTLDTLFPPDTQTTLYPSTGPLATDRVSELLFFDATTVGTSLAPSRRFYVTDTAWREVGSFAEAGDTVIEPGQAFIIRHPAGVALTTFVPNQQVYGGPVSVMIGGSAADKGRDTMIGLPRPVSITLDDLDFAPGQFVESATTDPGVRKDQLLVFDNAEALRNKQPDAVYFRSGGQWLSAESGSAAGTQSIEPSAGLLVRRAAGSGTTPILWVNSPTYDVTAP